MLEYRILQFQAQDLGDEFKLSRGLFLRGFCCTRVLVSITGECTLMSNDGDSIHEGDEDDMGVGDHGNKNISRQKSFSSLMLHLSFGNLTG